jgi:hypothetical protein
MSRKVRAVVAALVAAFALTAGAAATGGPGGAVVADHFICC